VKGVEGISSPRLSSWNYPSTGSAHQSTPATLPPLQIPPFGYKYEPANSELHGLSGAYACTSTSSQSRFKDSTFSTAPSPVLVRRATARKTSNIMSLLNHDYPPPPAPTATMRQETYPGLQSVDNLTGSSNFHQVHWPSLNNFGMDNVDPDLKGQNPTLVWHAQFQPQSHSQPVRPMMDRFIQEPERSFFSANPPSTQPQGLPGQGRPGTPIPFPRLPNEHVDTDNISLHNTPPLKPMKVSFQLSPSPPSPLSPLF
jgi:hypothetical protein